MNNESVLITGGCGFVGSNLAIQLKKDYPSFKIVALDNLKRRGSELNIARLRNHGIEFIHGDIRNKEDFDAVGDISVLIEAAAEPSVLAGIDTTPDYVLNTNLTGTVNCLNYAVKNKATFIFLSTSRVYPITNLSSISYTESNTRFAISDIQTLTGVTSKGVAEDFPLNGARSFYGTSKLASELLIQEYAAFYNIKSVINRCGIITGPWQMGKIDQGVMVLWLAKHYWKGELSYIGFGGQGKQTRDILHINDLYEIIKLQLGDIDRYHNGIYNIGGGNKISLSLCELTNLCKEITGNRINIRSVSETRTADVPIYISDSSTIHQLSGWEPKKEALDILKDIFEWIKANESNVKTLLS